jgi:hypothetical protein
MRSHHHHTAPSARALPVLAEKSAYWAVFMPLCQVNPCQNPVAKLREACDKCASLSQTCGKLATSAQASRKAAANLRQERKPLAKLRQACDKSASLSQSCGKLLPLTDYPLPINYLSLTITNY